LHFAACYVRLEIVRLLLEAGANPNAMDVNESTPLDVAMQNVIYDNEVHLYSRNALQVIQRILSEVTNK